MIINFFDKNNSDIFDLSTEAYLEQQKILLSSEWSNLVLLILCVFVGDHDHLLFLFSLSLLLTIKCVN